jgi:class 3 adenylate cyclase
MNTHALVVFTDIRGFTRWAEKNEVFARLNEFAGTFLGTLRKVFPKKAGYFLKGLGDGAMLVQEVDDKLDAQRARTLLEQLLGLVRTAEEQFATDCRVFAEAIGQRSDLRMGWGIVRGAVQKITSPAADYMGPNVNKAARLCDQARPFGIVIDRDDFALPPEDPVLKFFPQDRKLTGIDDSVPVWVTTEVANQFLTRERLRQSPEVHVAGQCIDTSSKKGLKILVAKRGPRRAIFPNLYEGCGGQLAAGETFTEGVARHFRMEMGIEVRVLEELHCFYVIREPNEAVIPGIRFLCERVDEKEPSSPNHVEWRWLSEKDFRGVPADQFVPGLRDQVLDLLEKYKQAGRGKN